jgi:hypothetical protein
MGKQEIGKDRDLSSPLRTVKVKHCMQLTYRLLLLPSGPIAITTVILHMVSMETEQR